MTAHPTLLLVGKLGGGANAHVVELAGYLSSDAPDILYWEQGESLVPALLGVDEATALVALVFLGKLGAYLGKRLRIGDADGDRDAHGSEHVG